MIWCDWVYGQQSYLFLYVVAKEAYSFQQEGCLNPMSAAVEGDVQVKGGGAYYARHFLKPLDGDTHEILRVHWLQ